MFGDEQSGGSAVFLMRHWTIAIVDGGIVVVRSTDSGIACLTSVWIGISMYFEEYRFGGPELRGSVDKRINSFVSKIFTEEPVKSHPRSKGKVTKSLIRKSWK